MNFVSCASLYKNYEANFNMDEYDENHPTLEELQAQVAHEKQAHEDRLKQKAYEDLEYYRASRQTQQTTLGTSHDEVLACSEVMELRSSLAYIRWFPALDFSCNCWYGTTMSVLLEYLIGGFLGKLRSSLVKPAGSQQYNFILFCTKFYLYITFVRRRLYWLSHLRVDYLCAKQRASMEKRFSHLESLPGLFIEFICVQYSY